MLVELNKEELKKIVFWLDFTTDKPLADKLRPILKQCTCKEPPND